MNMNTKFALSGSITIECYYWYTLALSNYRFKADFSYIFVIIDKCNNM